jgi:hypothetical protein
VTLAPTVSAGPVPTENGEQFGRSKHMLPNVLSRSSRHTNLRSDRAQEHRNASGRPKGACNGNYKHGLYTAEAIASRRSLRQQIRQVMVLTRRLRELSALNMRRAAVRALEFTALTNVPRAVLGNSLVPKAVIQ